MGEIYGAQERVLRLMFSVSTATRGGRREPLEKKKISVVENDDGDGGWEDGDGG